MKEINNNIDVNMKSVNIMRKTIVYIIYGECNNDFLVEGYYENIQSYFHGIESWEFCKKKVHSSSEFEKEIGIIREKISTGKYSCLYLDIHCHGNNYGLSFSDNTESSLIDWQSLYSMTLSINVIAEKPFLFNLLLSSCFSVGFAAFLHNNHKNDACKYLLCTTNVVWGLAVTEVSECIFKEISDGSNIIQAIESSNQHSYQDHIAHPQDPIYIFELFIFDD